MMRIMGFSIDWSKLNQDRFTTFRFERRDRDWAVGEVVQVTIRPRSKGGGDYLGNAVIVAKTPKVYGTITDAEAIVDGFTDKAEMWKFLMKSHPGVGIPRPLNKLILRWAN